MTEHILALLPTIEVSALLLLLFSAVLVESHVAERESARQRAWLDGVWARLQGGER